MVNRDLVAVDKLSKFHDEDELKKAVEKHVDWYSGQPSCFLSVFTDENHACNWAKQREDRDLSVYIHEISTARLPFFGTYVLDIELLIAKLDIYHPYSENELLFLHRIPSWSIVATKTPSGDRISLPGT